MLRLSNIILLIFLQSYLLFKGLRLELGMGFGFLPSVLHVGPISSC
jgi:hypothetical protein